jgi:hypothetical protein
MFGNREDKQLLFPEKREGGRPANGDPSFLHKSLFFSEKNNKRKTSVFRPNAGAFELSLCPFQKKESGRLQTMSNNQNKPGF